MFKKITCTAKAGELYQYAEGYPVLKVLKIEHGFVKAVNRRNPQQVTSYPMMFFETTFKRMGADPSEEISMTERVKTDWQPSGYKCPKCNGWTELGSVKGILKFECCRACQWVIEIKDWE